MTDIIQLLPDSVANQIAAGEVIQRPASVVKELAENAVDAGADEISIILKDAGRTLIQVIDNGIGMSDTDARLAFERHATSKIREAGDLFEIRTKGFRGEALASIAAIAHVVMKTRQNGEEIGTEVRINASEIEHQIQTSCAAGTNFVVKDLFYNVPARRKFLKSNTTELKHSINEFQRIALTHPEIAMNLVHNETDIYRLPKANFRQRIVHVFGKSINANLNTIETETVLVKIKGFIGKPELARKTTGEQFFFVNNRFMRHPYFHRAVMRAYEKILPSETFPAYFIYLNADPHSIDVNIHPTKTEIKFEDEQAIFRIIEAAVREALGKSNAVPSIDFETHGVVEIPVLTKNTSFRQPTIEVNPDYNPFEVNQLDRDKGVHSRKTPPEEWERLYGNADEANQQHNQVQTQLFQPDEEQPVETNRPEYIQVRNRYIVTSVKSGLMVIDQKLAHQRILYEQFIQSVAHNCNLAQRELYPSKIDLEPSDYMLIKEISEELAALGLEISDLGSNSIVVNSCPAGFECPDLGDLIESLLEEYKATGQKVKNSATKTLAASLSRAASIDHGKVLHHHEMQQLVDELFACENHNYTPNGKRIVAIVSLGELEKLLA
jgi:DNA mismatch repair protein MutL